MRLLIDWHGTAKPHEILRDRRALGFVYEDGGRGAAGFKGDAATASRARSPSLRASPTLRSTTTCMPRSGTMRRHIETVRPGACRGATGGRARHRAMACRRRSGSPASRSLVGDEFPQWGSARAARFTCADELPAGRLIVRVSKHLVAVVDGVIHDTHDCTRAGERCVYGYFRKA
jgi:hypothetical protein